MKINTRACCLATVLILSCGCDRGSNERAAVEITPPAVAVDDQQTDVADYDYAYWKQVAEEREALARSLAWPVANGFSNPNLIVYDKQRLANYRDFYGEGLPSICGFGMEPNSTMTIDNTTIKIMGPLSYIDCGTRFHADHLRQFLRARVANSTPVYDDGKPNAMQHYERDVCTCLELIANAKVPYMIPEVEALLGDECKYIQYAAIRVIHELGPQASSTAPALAELLESDLQSTVEEALGQLGAGAVPALIPKINAGSPKARIRAMEALRLIGPPASAAVDELLKALNENPNNPDGVDWAAARALSRIGDERAKPHLERYFGEPNSDRD